MILYLSSEKHTNLLDFWIRQPDREPLPMKKMVGSFILEQFVIYDMRNFAHVTELVLDRIAFHDSDEDFGKAIREFQTMYQSRITVIYEGLSQELPLFDTLLEDGVGNLVCGVEIEEIQRELSECLSAKGMVRYLAAQAKEEEPEYYQFNCENVRIAVVSSQPRMGATTAAIGLCSWLVQVGATAAYVEANDSGHLQLLARSYEMEVTKYGYLYEGVQYWTAGEEGRSNFIVYDFGTANNKNWKQIKSADLIVAAAGIKPYELLFTMKLQKRMMNHSLFLLLPFVIGNLRGDLVVAFENETHKIIYLEYQPELTNGTPNRDAYKKIIKKYIIHKQITM